MFGIERKYIKTNQVLINATKKGYKPACIATSLVKHPDVNVSTTCDRISYNKKTQNCTWYIDWFLNIQKVRDIISSNHSLFALRLGLDSDSPIEKIYNSLKAILAENDNKYHDIVGITLGFPKQNSMIYNLEKFAGMGYEQRKQPKMFKIKLLEALQREDSPYANLGNEKAELEKSIQNIGRIKVFSNPLYDFIEYVKEPYELDRIEQTTARYKKESKLLL